MLKVKQKIKDESGVTLVELLAAIAILSIIVTAFLAFFIQAANTNNRTDEVNEATFLAQEEMERVTYYSMRGQNADDYEQADDESEFSITTAIDSINDSELYKVIVEVEKGDGTDRAKMETRLPFENTENPLTEEGDSDE